MGLNFLFADLLEILKPNKGEITTLHLFNCLDIKYNNLLNLIDSGYLTNIVDLTMMGVPVDDYIMELLATKSNALRSLNVTHTEITGVGVKAIVLKEGCKLEQLNLKGCNCINFDVVEWARTQGVSILFKFPDNPLGKTIMAS